MDEINKGSFVFIQSNKSYWIGGIEICRKLEYANPREQAGLIWTRNKCYLKKNSTVVNMATVDGRMRNTRIYNEIGARFFITKCNKPSADDLTLKMIEAFVKLRDEGVEKSFYRNNSKLINRSLKDSVKNILKNEADIQKHKFLYMNIASNNCKSITGFSPKQIKEQRHCNFTRDALATDELVQIAALEASQAKYLENHPDLDRKGAYQAIKQISYKFNAFIKEIEE